MRMPRSLDLARVLLVDDELASRLTLQTILEAGGYCVDVAGSAAEALAKLDRGEYELVLSEADMDSPSAGLRVLAYARVKNYQPATGLVTAYKEARASRYPVGDQQRVSINTENVLALLGKVADLIGLRAQRRANRVLARAVQ
jgi:two-component system, NtrC family, response regulator AtoC